MQPYRSAHAPHPQWSSLDDRFPFAHVCQHIGPLSHGLAEQLARLELARGLLHTTDWSSPTAMARSFAGWACESGDRRAVTLQQIQRWHGDEVAELKRAVGRLGRGGMVTPSVAHSALTWRVRYLRKAFIELAGEMGHGGAAAAMADHARLTIGAAPRRAAKWYCFYAEHMPNPHVAAGG